MAVLLYIRRQSFIESSIAQIAQSFAPGLYAGNRSVSRHYCGIGPRFKRRAIARNFLMTLQEYAPPGSAWWVPPPAQLRVDHKHQTGEESGRREEPNADSGIGDEAAQRDEYQAEACQYGPADYHQR